VNHGYSGDMLLNYRGFRVCFPKAGDSKTVHFSIVFPKFSDISKNKANLKLNSYLDFPHFFRARVEVAFEAGP
jgi:hypothetical protein